MSQTDSNVWDLLSRVAGSVEEQTELHVEIAKAEFARDAGLIGQKSVPLQKERVRRPE